MPNKLWNLLYGFKIKTQMRWIEKSTDSHAFKETGSCISWNTTYLAIKAISDNLNEEKNENKWAWTFEFT